MQFYASFERGESISGSDFERIVRSFPLTMMTRQDDCGTKRNRNERTACGNDARDEQQSGGR